MGLSAELQLARNISFITSFAEYFSVQEYFVWKVFEWFQLVCSMTQDDAKSISIKFVSHLDSILNLCLKPLRGNVCDIEVFDGVLSQYFSGLNSMDILLQPPFESDSFQLFRCRKYNE